MDKQKQIEEMAKVLESKHLSMCTWDSYNDDFNDNYPNECKKVATALYNERYRKIPEGAVVLTREEYERYKKQDLFMKDYTIVEVLENETKKTRKVTAEEFALKLADYFVENCCGGLSISLTLQEWYKMIDEICKELTEI